MENIGKYLLEKRQEKGFSLEEISSRTKLHPNIIKSIEKDDFSKLGGTGYTKILITTYGRALGLSQSEIDNLMSKAPKGDNRIPRQPKEVLHPPTILIHKNLILFILLLILIAVLSYAVVRLYRDETISFPFRNRVDTEETIEDPLPLDEPELEDLDHIDALELNLDDSELDEYLAVEYSEIPVETATAAEEARKSFTADRNDYLTKYEIFSRVVYSESETDLFDQYIRSF